MCRPRIRPHVGRFLPFPFLPRHPERSPGINGTVAGRVAGAFLVEVGGGCILMRVGNGF